MSLVGLETKYFAILVAQDLNEASTPVAGKLRFSGLLYSSRLKSFLLCSHGSKIDDYVLRS